MADTYYRGLSVVSGIVMPTLLLAPSDFNAGDGDGYPSSLSGSMALVGSPYDNIGINNSQGSAYLFRNVTTATGTVNQQAKLQLSFGKASDYLGFSVAPSGNRAIVSTREATGANVYLYTGLDTATGTIYESARLAYRGGGSFQAFGGAPKLSLEGGIGVVAPGGTEAYLDRGLDTLIDGTVGQNAIRKAYATSISGNTALLAGGNRTTAYLFRNLDTVGTAMRRSSSTSARAARATGSIFPATSRKTAWARSASRFRTPAGWKARPTRSSPSPARPTSPRATSLSPTATASRSRATPCNSPSPPCPSLRP